jgi:uncharacterized protein (DUF2252 family)
MSTIKKRIKDFNKDYLADKVQLKYSFMAENAYRFYRGTCHLFYEDLAHSAELPSSPLVWASGDLHIENFGSYKSANGLVYFDLNDFDEALLAPAIWELVRMVTSIYVAFEALEIGEEEGGRMAKLYIKAYCDIISKGKALYIEPQVAQGIVCTFLAAVSDRKKKDLLQKKTIRKKGKMSLLLDDDRHLPVDKPLKKALKKHITDWINNNSDGPYNYKVIDTVFRIAGTGSVGVKRYAFLLKSKNKLNDNYLILDMKQATPSSLRPYVHVAQPKWASEADRMLTIQTRMQNISPALLSTTVFERESYVIQEMQPTKDKINFKVIKDRYRDIYQVIYDMATLTASAQLRSSGHQGAAVADDLIAFGKSDKWQEPILAYAKGYAKKVRKDHRAFVKAYKEGYFNDGETPLAGQKEKVNGVSK